jgi:hypothetical protein
LNEIMPEPAGFRLEPIDYGIGCERSHRLKVRRLKTQANHKLRLNHVVFAAWLFASVGDRLKEGRRCCSPTSPIRSRTAAHRTNTSLPGFRTVAFDHLLDGTRLFCGCARSAHDRMSAEVIERAPGYAPDSWPHRTMNLLASPSYREGICHFCISDKYGPEIRADRRQSVSGVEVVMLDANSDGVDQIANFLKRQLGKVADEDLAAPDKVSSEPPAGVRRIAWRCNPIVRCTDRRVFRRAPRRNLCSQINDGDGRAIELGLHMVL